MNLINISYILIQIITIRSYDNLNMEQQSVSLNTSGVSEFVEDSERPSFEFIRQKTTNIAVSKYNVR